MIRVIRDYEAARIRRGQAVYQRLVRSLLIFSCVAFAAACRGGAESLTETPATSYVFSVELWPGEGIPVIVAQRAPLSLHAAPDTASPIIDAVTERVGARLVFDSTRYQTLKAGTITVTDTLTVNGRFVGNVRHLSRTRYYSPLPDTAITLAPPARIDFLQHRAEGTCFIRIGDSVIDARRCPVLDTSLVRVEREPVTQWWIGLRGVDGNFGWVVVSDSTAKPVRREF